jgi:hypothetical protein
VLLNQLNLLPEVFLQLEVLFPQFVVFLLDLDMVLDLLTGVLVSYQLIVLSVELLNLLLQLLLLLRVEFQCPHQISHLELSLGQLIS